MWAQASVASTATCYFVNSHCLLVSQTVLSWNKALISYLGLYPVLLLWPLFDFLVHLQSLLCKHSPISRLVDDVVSPGTQQIHCVVVNTAHEVTQWSLLEVSPCVHWVQTLTPARCSDTIVVIFELWSSPVTHTVCLCQEVVGIFWHILDGLHSYFVLLCVVCHSKEPKQPQNGLLVLVSSKPLHQVDLHVECALTHLYICENVLNELLQSWLPICDEHCLVLLFIEFRHEHNELLEEVSPVAHVFIWGNTVGNRDKIPTLVFAYNWHCHSSGTWCQECCIQGKHWVDCQCNSLALWDSYKGSPEVVSFLWLLQVTVPFDLSSIFCHDFWLAHKVQEVLNKDEVTTVHFLHSFLQPVDCVSICLQLVFLKELSDFLPSWLLLQDICCFWMFAQLSECVGWFGLFHSLMLTVSQVTVFNWEQSRASLLVQLDKEPTWTHLLRVPHIIVLAVDPHSAIIIPNSQILHC